MKPRKEITIVDVAHEAEVSIATASRALNNRVRVAEKTRRAVREAANRLQYRVSSSKYNIYGILLPAGENSLGLYGYILLDALRKILRERGDRALILSLDDAALLEENQIAGVISFDYSYRAGHEFPRLRNIPLVCINERGNSMENVSSVRSNSRQGIALGLDHLTGLGHWQIGFLQYYHAVPLEGQLKRMAIFSEEMIKRGLSPVAFARSFGKDLPLFEAIAMLLRQKCTAIMVQGEDNAQKALSALHLMGRRVPEDISLLVWDSEQAFNAFPRLTALGQDFPEMAAKALELLDNHKVEDIEVDYKLTVRESTAPPPAAGNPLK